MKTAAKKKTEKHPAIEQDFHHRLSELEKELRLHPDRKAAQRPLSGVIVAPAKESGNEKTIPFTYAKKSYAAGRSDVTFAGSNHARGNRHIRLYLEGVNVLEVEGDFEDQQFGSNFRFHNIVVYQPGVWEADFLKLTNRMREFAAKRKLAFKKKVDAARDKHHRNRFL